MRAGSSRAASQVPGPLHVERVGSGPPMVLLHGLGSSHVHWRPVRRRLGRSYSLHAVDLPGFGLTPLAGRSPEVIPNAHLVSRFLHRLDEPAVVMGNSMGALIALLAVREAPGAASALVLVSPPAPRPLLAALEPRLAVLLSAYLWPVVGEVTRELYVRRLGPEGLTRNLLEVCCSDPDAVSSDVVAAARKLAARRPHDEEVHAFLAAYRSLWRYLLNGRRFDALLRSVDVPTLVVDGDADRLLPPAIMDRLLRVRPDWAHIRLAGAGHMPHVDRPDEFLRAVNSWLSRTLRDRRAG
jgi:pimeloyl-ACP methyl ester carboxylesterase